MPVTTVFDTLSKTYHRLCSLNTQYDHIWEIDKEVSKVNAANGWQLGIHVDAASGGFIAPFQETAIPPFDFRLPNVLTMSASGHKFGESCCGTGWVIFRQREDLAEHIAVSGECARRTQFALLQDSGKSTGRQWRSTLTLEKHYSHVVGRTVHIC